MCFWYRKNSYTLCCACAAQHVATKVIFGYSLDKLHHKLYCAGRHVQARNSVYKHYVTQPCQKSIEPKAIPKIVSILSTDVRRHLSSPCRPALRTISCHVSSPTKVGLFNARSVASSGKSQSILTWVSELKLTAAGLVETWHDGPDTPALVACAPPGYVYTERSRPRPDDKVDTISTNHGGVCLIYSDSSIPRSARHSNT